MPTPAPERDSPGRTERAPGAAPPGALRITVVYPSATDVVQGSDSTFLFGTVGRGDALLRVNGAPVPVLANGAWIAWVPLPDDSAADFQLVAVANEEVQTASVQLRLAPRFRPPPGSAVWIDTASFAPAGELHWPAGEGVRLAVRAAPGATVRLVTPSGTVVPFVPDSLPAEPAWGIRAFGVDSATYRLPPRPDRYVAWLPAEPVCPDTLAGAPCATLEVAAGLDTARAVWPVRLQLLELARPAVVVLNDDTARTGTTDSVTAGRAVPGGTYHWFFPTGTTAVVSGRRNDQVRLALSRGATAWVNAADVQPLPAGTPPPGGVVGSVRLHPGATAVTLRVPLPSRLPFRVEEEDRSLTLRLYGAASDLNWMQYGGTDALVRRMGYLQEAADELTITLELSQRVWGYRTRFDGRDLLLEVRRPPVIDPRHPLRGRTIVLDPGHPPLGATGPAGLLESAATLAVALKARTLLERAGATAHLTRDDDTPVDLIPRLRFAEAHEAEVLVSIHANALPDGVNPFVNNGTSVYYFHPRSADLARALDHALVGELGLRDLGMGRGDYALVRPTWMPAALTEGVFLMMPEQELVLASEDGQWRYARGIVAGLDAFLRGRARDP
ncbi:MAG: N-acetylmuramoyl-L-alanine amidase family protein [Gemmatimonadales bacterium]